MKRMTTAFLTALLASIALAQDGVELRYKFEKGEKVKLQIKYAMSVKIDQVPEAFQGLIPESPIDMKAEGLVDAEVTGVDDAGKATLEGKWRTLKVKGTMMMQDLDFAYDAEKKGEEKKKKAEGDEGLPGFGNVEDGLKMMAETPVKMVVEKDGRLKVQESGGARGMGGMSSQFLSLNGLMGSLPKDKVAKGGSWKSDEKLAMPGVGGTVDIRIKSENTYAADEKVGDYACALIQSKYTVGGEGEGKQADPAQGFSFKMKTSGEGEGKLWFAAKEGRAAKAQNALKVKVSATVPNPGGGDDIEIKATLKIDQSHELGK